MGGNKQLLHCQVSSIIIGKKVTMPACLSLLTLLRWLLVCWLLHLLIWLLLLLLMWLWMMLLFLVQVLKGLPVLPMPLHMVVLSSTTRLIQSMLAERHRLLLCVALMLLRRQVLLHTCVRMLCQQHTADATSACCCHLP